MSTISADEFFDRLHRIVSVLDEENVKIIRTMKNVGPRNLQNIARVAKIPYTTVYSRVTKLESDHLLTTRIHPNYSGIGLSQANLVITPFPGRELVAREAIRIPGYWLRIVQCRGESYGFFVQVAIPSANTRHYEEYLDQLVARGIIRNYRLTWLEENFSPIPNFDYYSLDNKTWKFDWQQWTRLLKHPEKNVPKKSARSDKSSYDKRDLLILKELVKNARITLAELAKMLSVTLPAAKYRFDSLADKGLIADYIISILPFASEISELAEVRMDFKDTTFADGAQGVLSKLPFVLTYAPIKGLNSISVRVYIPRTETHNLLTLLSRLIGEKVLTNYSYLQLDPMTMLWSTFGYKDYSDENGWFYDNRKYLETVENLVATRSRRSDDDVEVHAESPQLLQ